MGLLQKGIAKWLSRIEDVGTGLAQQLRAPLKNKKKY